MPSRGDPHHGSQHLRSADRAYERILASILRSDLAPGTRLVEAQLAKRMDLSRTPLREALFRLEQEGLVESSIGRGFSVRSLTEREARETYPLVAALEAEGLAEGAELILADLEALKKANRAFSAARSARRAIDADQAFHLILVSRSSNSLLIRMVRNLYGILLRYELLYMSDLAMIAESAKQHHAIIDFIAAGSIEEACAAISYNYQHGMRALVHKIRASV